MFFRCIIRLYQLLLSPLLGCNCRFMPSCSHYAEDAFRRFSAHKAAILTLKRLLRCHPWGKSGYDPVPEK